jgi:hypothetical protein
MSNIWLISDTPKYKCVCIEQIDFTAIHIEDVRHGRTTRI